MAKLKLGTIADDKPVKLTVELPADVHRDLAMRVLEKLPYDLYAAELSTTEGS